MPTDTLHARVRAAVEHRLALARAASPGNPEGDTWTTGGYVGWLIEDQEGDPVVYDEGALTETQTAHIAANDPASIIALCEGALRILDRHRPVLVDERHIDAQTDWLGRHYCASCPAGHSAYGLPPTWYPCPDALALAAMFGVPEEASDG
jgi:hypothetical protein